MGIIEAFFLKKIMWHSQLLPSRWIVYVQKPYLDLREGEAPQLWKRQSEVPREWHCRNPSCYLRHLFLLSNTIKADTAHWRQPQNCSAREKSKLMSLVSLLYLQKRTLALRHATLSPSESTEIVLKHKM